MPTGPQRNTLWSRARLPQGDINTEGCYEHEYS